ncbi:nucleoside recognition domain-containing protein [Syntrophomonas erecta]
MTWELAKVMVPVYIVVTLLKYTPVLPWISDRMVPIMHLVGLPGEASVPLVMGYFLNIYAAIGAMLPLGLSIKEITILGAMLLLAHSLPMETAVAKKTGVKVFSLVMVRIVLSFLAGAFFNLVL